MDAATQIAKHISDTSSERKKLSEQILKSNPEIVSKVQKQDLKGLKICGVDGGFLRKEFHGVTLLIRRAVGVCFEYKKGQVLAQYLPEKNPQPESFVLTPDFSPEDANVIANLKRVELEIKVALECAQKFSPDLLLLDGSIVLHPSSIPKKDSAAYELYKQVILMLRDLYKCCEDNQIMLAGACEDSRGKKFCNVLSNQLLRGKPEARVLDCANDTTFLYYLLNVGERTNHFSYTASEDLPGLSDIGEWRRKIFGVYVKPAEFDRPLRIDFLASNPQLQADKIAAIVNAISKHNKTYAYPSVLIEADARAKLSEPDLMAFYHSLKEKLGMDPSIFELRREQRPL
ncbi:DNA double-strand break repair nuclease NurA [Candidatus Woesearchaeota archaeon]|nr:DNA double-strand break repair nuclease NurA [Candidatus Woesearchaeota archaeon]